ncbi:WDFY family member 4, partial [Clonorchis sinensis]
MEHADVVLIFKKEEKMQLFLSEPTKVIPSFDLLATQRLMYIIHYCTGGAKAAIEGCVLFPESDGFLKTMDILPKEFGRPHDIAQSFIDSILVGGPIAAEDNDALKKLVREMDSCEIALTKMGYIAALNCSTNLKRIVMRLPRHLQREWAKVADNILHEPKEPSIPKLTQFLERNLSAVTNMYGQLAGGANRVFSRGVDDISRRGKLPRSHFNAVASKALIFPVCTALHSLCNCAAFQAKSPEEKLQALRERKLCFSCLKLDHRADKCRAHNHCGVSRCGFLPVRLLGPNGAVLSYALLRDESDSTLLSLEVADRIGLKETAYSTDKLPLMRPTVPSREFLRRWSHLRDTTLPRIASQKVSILIDTNVPDAHRVIKQRVRTSKTPYASLTVFGWVVLGPSGSSGSKTTTINHLNTQQTIESDIIRLFEPEFSDQRPKSDTSMSIEEKRVLSLAKQSISFMNGHCHVRLPWKHRTPEFYEINVYPFGATSSPFCATFSLRQTAYDNCESFDENTFRIVERNYCVDDCLVSVDSAHKALRLVDQLPRFLKRGGFHLHKWVSNNDEVFSHIPVYKRATDLVSLNSLHPDTHKTLGLFKCVKTDSFKFKLTMPGRPVANRGIPSCAVSLYDPLGYVAPLLLHPKYLLQEVCRSKRGWDEEFNQTIQDAWKKWRNDIQIIESLVIPRCVKSKQFVIEHQSLHIFSDASEVGYGAVAYLRCESLQQVHCSLLMGKSRVAPIKSVTLPRLELQAAVLAVRLMCHLLKQLE